MDRQFDRSAGSLVYTDRDFSPWLNSCFVRIFEEAPMKRCLALVSAIALVLCAAPAFAQQKATAQNVPEIPYTSVPNLLKVPAGEFLGEAVGVATNSKGHIFVYHRSANTRLWEFDKNGSFRAQVGSEKPGKEPGQFNLPHGLQVDGQGNVWVADRSNIRYQVLDNNLKPKTVYDNLGVGWTVCVSQGPHQYVFASNSNPNGNTPGSWAITGEIYKLELDGTIIGKFGHASKEFGGFQVVHMMDCRNPNEIVVGEIESWRVQRLILQPTPTKTSSAR